MTLATILTAVALVTGIMNSNYARPLDPFGGNTVEVQDGLLFDNWSAVIGELAGDHAMFTACAPSTSAESASAESTSAESTSAECAPARTLRTIIAEARQERGVALIGHINRAINLSIKPYEPSEWLTALDAINAEGDCKAYATAKYFALREAGIPANRVRLVIVHERDRVEDHMVVAVYQDSQWLILDNLTLALVPATVEPKYTALFVLDHEGVRRILAPDTTAASTTTSHNG